MAIKIALGIRIIIAIALQFHFVSQASKLVVGHFFKVSSVPTEDVNRMKIFNSIRRKINFKNFKTSSFGLKL